MWCLLAILGLLSNRIESTVITGISTVSSSTNENNKAGSYNGGTYLYIHGDFQSELANYNVYVGPQKCIMVHFYSDSSTIQCTVPPALAAFPSPVLIKVVPATDPSTGAPVDTITYGSGVQQGFTYNYDRTPWILYVNPTEGCPGDTITFNGRWGTTDQTLIVQATVGTQLLAVDPELTTLDYWGWYGVSATVNDNQHGDLNASIVLNDRFGNSAGVWVGNQFTLNGSSYTFRTLGRIDSISNSEGSSAGGLNINITGAGFPVNSVYNISAGGSRCNVTSVTYNTISCTLSPFTPPSPAPTVYKGNAGVKREVWQSTLSFSSVIGVVTPDLVQYLALPQIPNNEGTNFQDRLYGLFVAPVTGAYTFFISSDDNGQVFLSTDSSPANAKSIINFSGYTDYKAGLISTGTQSSPINLVAGNSYYLEAQHYQYGGNSIFELGVQIPTTGSNQMPYVQEVTISPPSVLRQSQKLTVSNPTKGSLGIAFGKNSANTVSWNSASSSWLCSDIQYSLNKLGLGNFLCSLTSTSSSLVYNITLNYPNTGTNPYVMFTLPSGQTILPTISAYGTIALGGTFTVTYQSVTSPPISPTTWIRSIEYQLNLALPALNGQLVLKGTNSGDGIHFFFMIPSNLYVPGSSFIIDSSTLTGGYVEFSGGTNTVIVNSNVNYTPGSSIYYPVIPSDYLRTYQTSPQITVDIDGVRAVCRGSCNFTVKSPPVYPELTALSVTGQVLTIIGTKFNTTQGATTVSIGHGPCAITSVTTTSITCTLPQYYVAGLWLPVVFSANQGYVSSSIASSSSVPLPLVINSVTPPIGSTEGGTVLTIAGVGFLDSLSGTAINQTVDIGGNNCAVLTTSTSQLTCLTSKQAAGTTSVLTVNVGSLSVTSNDFNYAAAPSITGISPSSASTIDTTTIQISGTSFTTDLSLVTVQLVNSTLGTYSCLVKASTLTLITCDILGGPNGIYNLQVNIQPVGLAAFSSVPSTFPLVLSITSITPSKGSTLGGTNVTVTGTGFSLNPLYMMIFFQDTSSTCQNVSIINTTTLTCITPPIGSKTAEVPYNAILLARLSYVATYDNPVSFTWAVGSTPVINSLSSSTGKSADVITFNGANFGTSASGVSIYFGPVLATVNSVTSTAIQAVVPSVQGSSLTISINIASLGNVQCQAPCSLNFNNQIYVTSLSLSTVSEGGDDITIAGSGFDPSMTYQFGSAACKIKSVSGTAAICQLSPAPTGYSNPLLLKIVGTTQSYTCTTSSLCGISYSSSLKYTISSFTGSLVLTTSTLAAAVTLPAISVFLTPKPSPTVPVVYSCIVSAFTTTSITCSPNAPPGTYLVSSHITGYGYASSATTYTITLTITSATASDSSYSGGQNLTITGTGLYLSTIVTLCGFPCSVAASTGNSLQCVLPALPTGYSQPQYSVQTTSILLSSSQFNIIQSGTASNAAKAFDQDTTTFYQDPGNQNAYIGIDVGSGYSFNLSLIKFNGGGNLNANYQSLKGIILQSSNDGVAWTNVTIFSYINNFWNTWGPNPANVYNNRYFRLFLYSAPGTFAINEIQFYGTLLYNVSTKDASCPVNVLSSVGGTPIVATTPNINYKDSLTGFLNSIVPSNGTVLGSTVVHFNGVGFGTPASSDVTVLIDGIPCAVSSVTNTLIVCKTGPRLYLAPPSLSIFIKNVGYVATNGLVYLYADLWSSTTTWGGQPPPVAGDAVVIPTGLNIILDVPTPLLSSILIQGSLIVQDSPGITIDAYYIFVYGGLFQIGTEKAPYLNNITITIHGDKLSPSLPYYGNKFIAVRTGTLDIHGNPRSPSWTTLKTTANVGDQSITVQDLVDWQPGEQIVLATTSYSLGDTEVKTIVSVNQYVITLDSPLNSLHYAKTETYGTDTIEIRGEVGLLTRNIKIRGSDDSLANQYGAHIMLYFPGNESCVGRIENAEIFHAGQAYNLGRYAIHFHLIGRVSGSYIRNNSIHDTFNRATTVHGVQYLTISNNVAYNIMGHTYFIEDGIETQNTFINNLGVNTRASFSLLNLDQTPATFWITNPTNNLLNNHAAGSDAYGYWYSMTTHPTGPSADDNVWPEFMPMGVFQDNTAHSVARYGLRIFHRFLPSLNPVQPPTLVQPRSLGLIDVPVTANFERFTAWKCLRNGAIGEDIGDLRFIDFKVADNVLGGIEMTYTFWTQWYSTTRVQNALVIGDSGNTEGICNGTIGIRTAQTDGMFVDGAHFYNFNDQQFPLGDESHSFKHPTRDPGARLVKLQGLSFKNSHTRIFWDIPIRGFYQILDASLTGTAGDFVVPYWNHLITPECTNQPLFNSIVCTSSKTGADARKIRRVSFYNLTPFNLFSNVNITVGLNDTVGNGIQGTTPMWSSLTMEKGGKNHNIAWNVPFLTGYTYAVFWDHTPLDWTSLSIELDTFDGPEWVILQLNFTDHREFFSASRGVVAAGTVTTAPGYTDPTILLNKGAPLASSDPCGTFIFDNVTQPHNFEILISGVQGNSSQWGDIKVTPYRCYGASCSSVSDISSESGPVTVLYWSKPTTWPSGSLPTNGTYVEIPKNWHLYLDIDTPVLHEIEINGVLEFAPGVNASLHANWIFVRSGSIVSGSDTNPTFKNTTHKIILHGLPTDDSFAFNPAIEAGNKVLVVTGNITMYGYPKNTTTQLEQNAYPGSNIIFVTGVDWDIGDTIVISPSGFAGNESEVFNITNIIGKIANYDDIQSGNSVPFVDFSTDSDWIAANSYTTVYGKNTSYNTKTNILSPLSTGITKIVLSGKLQFYHSGSSFYAGTNLINMKTEVALLSRNVRIDSDGNGWQPTILVNDFNDILDTNQPNKYGFVNLSHVYVGDCGQLDTDLSCLRFESSGTNPSQVSNSVFNNSGTWAIYMNEAKNINFVGNVINNPRWRGIVATSIQNVNITDNLVIRNSQRGYVEAILDAAAGYHICSTVTPACQYNLINNKVLGFDFAGFIVSGGECTGTTKIVQSNKAKSGRLGFIFTNNNGFDCMGLSNLKIHFCEDGISFLSSTFTFKISGLEFIENLVGIAIRTDSRSDFIPVSASFSNSLFVGTTLHSDYANCSSVDSTQRRGYMFGVSLTVTDNIKMTSKLMLPLSGATHESNVLGQHNVNGVTFINYNDNPYCAKSDSYAITSNSQAPDYEIPQFFSAITFINVGPQNKIFMDDPDPAWLNPDDCVNWNCTGPLNALGVDLDGSIVGGKGGYILPNNPTIAKKDICSFNLHMNAYFCKSSLTDPNYYSVLIFESMDSDNTTRTFSPINVTSYGSSFKNVLGGPFRDDLANFQDHTWDGFYTGHIRWSRFPAIVWSGQYYNITSAGTLPGVLKFHLQATQGNNQPIIVSIYYQNPSLVQLLDSNGNVIQPITYQSNGSIAECQFSDPHGTNRWYDKSNIIQFVLKNESPVFVSQSTSVQLNMYISMPITSFYATNGPTSFIDAFATMLKIPAYRIRIVNITPGSVILYIIISPDPNLTTPAAITNELTNVNAVLTTLLSNGTVASVLNVTIISASSNLATPVTATSATTDGSQSTSSSTPDVVIIEPIGPVLNPSGVNQGKSKTSASSFTPVVEDWVVALFVGFLFLVIIFSGLILYKKNANRTISLQEVIPGQSLAISRDVSSEISEIKKPAWNPGTEEIQGVQARPSSAYMHRNTMKGEEEKIDLPDESGFAIKLG